MGLLGKLLGRSEENKTEQAATSSVNPQECSHATVTPRWDAMEDMGKEDKALYVCDACHHTLTADEASRSNAVANRLRT